MTAHPARADNMVAADPIEDGFQRIWQPYYDTHPEHRHADGCAYCRGLITTKTSRAMVESGLSKSTGRKPTCAK